MGTRQLIITDRYIAPSKMTQNADIISGFLHARIQKADDPIWESVRLVPSKSMYVNRRPYSFGNKKEWNVFIDLVIEMSKGKDILLAFSYSRYGEYCASVLEKQLRSRNPEASVYRVCMLNEGSVAFGKFLSHQDTDAETALIWYNTAFMFDVTPDSLSKLPLNKAKIMRRLYKYGEDEIPNINPRGSSSLTALMKTRFKEV